MIKEKVAILEELKDYTQFVNVLLVDKGEKKPAKLLYDPKLGWKQAATNDSNTWGTYEEAKNNLNKEFKLPKYIYNNPKTKEEWKDPKNCMKESLKFENVLGFVLTKKDPFLIFDYDNCNIEEIKKFIKNNCNNSYSELSMSTLGLHSICKFPSIEDKEKFCKYMKDNYNSGNKIRTTKNAELDIELFFGGGYVAITGNVAFDCNEIKEITLEQAINIVENYIKPEKKKKDIHTFRSFSENVENEFINNEDDIYRYTPITLTDDEIIEKCMKYLNQGNHFSELYDNPSRDKHEDDYTIIKAIAYFTQDIDQITRIMRNSPMNREKFNRTDYLVNSIKKAIQARINYAEENGIFAFWQDDYKQPQTKIELTKNQKITLKKIKKVYKIFIDKLESEIKIIQKKGEKNLSKEEIKFIEQKSKYIESLNDSIESGKTAIEAYSIFEDNNLASKITKFKELFLVKYKIYYIGNQINPYYLSQLISLYFPMIYWAGKLLMYHEGVYKSVEQEYLKKIFFYILEKRDTRKLKGELLDQIYSINHIPIENFHNIIESKNNVINFKNGLLTFDENFLLTGNIAYKLESHTPEYKSVYQVAYDFNDKLTIEEILKNTPKFTKFLNTSLNDEKEKRLALEKLAYTLFNRRVCQEITYICGEGGNGKGTYQRILQELHKCVIKNPDITELTDPEKRNNFFTGKLLLTPAIFSSEAKKTIKDTSLLKKNSGNDSLSFELKHKNGDFNMPLYEKIFISTNHTVKFLNWEKADERRAHFLEMNNKIKIDNELEQIILNKEMDYVLMYVIHKGLFPLITRKFKTFTLPDSHYRLFKHYQEYNNNILCFINKHIEVDPNGTLLKANIKPLFNNEFSGVYKNTSNLIEKFETELKNQNIEFLSGKVRGKDINGYERAGYVGYKGIKYVEFKEDENIDANEDI